MVGSRQVGSSRMPGAPRSAGRLCHGAEMTDDPDHRFDVWQEAPFPEVSPSKGIRVFDRRGREIVALPPNAKLYTYLIARLSAELQRMTARADSD